LSSCLSLCYTFFCPARGLPINWLNCHIWFCNEVTKQTICMCFPFCPFVLIHGSSERATRTLPSKFLRQTTHITLFQVVTSEKPPLRNDDAAQTSWCPLQCLQWRHIRSLTKTGRGQLTGNSCGPSSHSATLKVLGSCLWNTYCSWDARTVAEVIRRYVSFLLGLVWHFPRSKWRACPGSSVVVRYIPTRSSGKTLWYRTRRRNNHVYITRHFRTTRLIDLYALLCTVRFPGGNPWEADLVRCWGVWTLGRTKGMLLVGSNSSDWSFATSLAHAHLPHF